MTVWFNFVAFSVCLFGMEALAILGVECARVGLTFYPVPLMASGACLPLMVHFLRRIR
ncbi:MAG: hypothetical protein ACREJC_13995 [Tepidisphaeraceae bacterium]